MECDMCGRRGEDFVLAKVEGVDMRLCERCSPHGQILKKPKIAQNKVNQGAKASTSSFAHNNLSEEETEETIVEDLAQIMRKERQKKGMEQEEFAKLISEKLSILQKIESGNFTPPIETVKRFGRKLGINLIKRENKEIYSKEDYSSSKQGLTLGDLMRKR